jgi:hypothetical protein
MSIGKSKMGKHQCGKNNFPPENKQLAQQFGQRRSSKPSTRAFCSTKKNQVLLQLKRAAYAYSTNIAARPTFELAYLTDQVRISKTE